MEKRSLISTRYVISKRDKRVFFQRIKNLYDDNVLRYVSSAKKIEIVKTRINNLMIIAVDSKPLFMVMNKKIVPTVVGFIKYEFDTGIPRVYVDSGAVPHVLNGADVMAPGIVSISEDFEIGKIVYVGEYKSKRVFSVGEALMDSKKILEVKHGRAIKNLHYAGDKIWKLIIDEIL